jgi:glycosyltransferase involved in cell wall biosynthesis
MRLAFVVQRYGLEVNGGAEALCRLLAERIVARPEVERVTVLTTCARDYVTWANVYPPGPTVINGVHVERFPTIFPRLKMLQGVASVVRAFPHPEWAEWPWLMAQGPVAPALIDRLQQVEPECDAIALFTYLYYPTVVGMNKLRSKRIFFPCAHDEPAMRMVMFRTLFALSDAIAFNSEDEGEFARGMFPIAGKLQSVIGCGVTLPDESEVHPSPVPEAPFVLYLGRIAKEKGVADLGRHFVRFKAAHADTVFQGTRGPFRGADLRLVIAGAGDTKLLPKHPDIQLAGFVDEHKKRELLATSEALMMPSRFESLSIVMLEAWTLERPVLVDRECSVTNGHVKRSGGGFAYHGEDEFVDALHRLLRDAPAAREMGLAGKRYTTDNFAWDKVEDRFIDLVRRVSGVKGS